MRKGVNYIALDLNEAGVQLVLDNNNRVLSYSGMNIDGEGLVNYMDYTDYYIDDALYDIVSKSLLTDNSIDNSIMLTAISIKGNGKWEAQAREKLSSVLSVLGINDGVKSPRQYIKFTNLGEKYRITPEYARIVLGNGLIKPKLSFDSVKDYNNKRLITLLRDIEPINTQYNKLLGEREQLNKELETLDQIEDWDEIVSIEANIREIENDLLAYQLALDRINSKSSVIL